MQLARRPVHAAGSRNGFKNAQVCGVHPAFSCNTPQSKLAAKKRYQSKA
jgi:hypothetical protein